MPLGAPFIDGIDIQGDDKKLFFVFMFPYLSVFYLVALCYLNFLDVFRLLARYLMYLLGSMTMDHTWENENNISDTLEDSDFADK